MSASPAILLVVHPGSLCGSLAFHCPDSARLTRNRIADKISRWGGIVAVIDSDLSDELPRYDRLNRAVARAALRTPGSPWGSGLARAAKRVVSRLSVPHGARVEVTGAWHDRDGAGCVNTVARALRSLGYRPVICPLAPAADGD